MHNKPSIRSLQARNSRAVWRGYRVMMTWKGLPICLMLLLCVLCGRGLFLDPHPVVTGQWTQSMPEIRVKEISRPGHVAMQVAHLDWQGQVTLLHVWSTWCAVCRHTHPDWMQHRGSIPQGVRVYGMLYKDTEIRAYQWLSVMGNPYQRLFVDSQGSSSIELGVYGTPETFLIDSKGRLRYKHVGAMLPLDWQVLLQQARHCVQQTHDQVKKG